LLEEVGLQKRKLILIHLTLYLFSDEGYLMAMPNNRIMWKDSNWITTGFPMSLKDIKVDTHIPSVESVSDRWVSENTNSYYYDIEKLDN
jgi:hypothetical protein